ncbi:MAG TPA: peptidylprolyl isomerase, partial [Pirellulaceae bacterium]|nr:peptidylprolyl isomerase [Pirellulaceae bacterium]
MRGCLVGFFFSGAMVWSNLVSGAVGTAGPQDVQDEVVQDVDADQEAVTDDPPTDPATDPTPKLTTYMAMQRQLRTLDEQITRILRAVPIGDVQRRREMMATVDQMKARKQQIHEALPQAAIDAYIESPETNQVVTAHVVSLIRDLLAETINPQRFDPDRAYEIATHICATETTNQALVFLAGRACFVTQRFDEAERYLQRLVELGTTIPNEAFETLSKTREHWARELTFREVDETASLPRVRLKTTAGDVVIELFEDQAPNTVARFLDLVEKKFYDGMIFYQHRPGQFSSTGCLRGDGSTAFEYFIPSESQLDDARHHFVG